MKTTWKDDIFEGDRKYQMIKNDDDTVSFVDVTEYTQEGDAFGAKELNSIAAELNDKSAGTLKTPRDIKVNLESDAAASFDGSADASPGVSGVLPVKHGGTGASTRGSAYKGLSHVIVASKKNLDDCKEAGIYYFPASYTPENIPIGVNGWLEVNVCNDSAVKQIWRRHGTADDNDYMTYVRTYTGNVWSQWTRYMTNKDINRSTAVQQNDTNYTTYMARGIALVTTVPSSMVNGAVAFVYE